MERETLARIARVLRAANARPFHKEQFYPIKSAILHAYAIPEPFDVQRIVQECWGCGGTGKDCGDFNDCHRCMGDGIYSVVYVKLARFNLCGHIFHEPIERLPYDEADYYVRLANANQIEGIIKHKRCMRSYVACAAIGRLFDLGYYWNTLSHIEASRFQHTCRRSDQITKWVVDGKELHPLTRNFLLHRIPVFELPKVTL